MTIDKNEYVDSMKKMISELKSNINLLVDKAAVDENAVNMLKDISTDTLAKTIVSDAINLHIQKMDKLRDDIMER
jgi:hypothetical protein